MRRCRFHLFHDSPDAPNGSPLPQLGGPAQILKVRICDLRLDEQEHSLGSVEFETAITATTVMVKKKDQRKSCFVEGVVFSSFIFRILCGGQLDWCENFKFQNV
ncbi:hypothetical protein DVH24_042311 [Malus domestica]|uniref:Uncharacterized protein n=1 Tax=Malus domestica TaxID=3750 RepID=A0A498IYF2_MALDO|nr:hypothetical protein DVH24_042311 [Malus domestica]